MKPKTLLLIGIVLAIGLVALSLLTPADQAGTRRKRFHESATVNAAPKIFVPLTGSLKQPDPVPAGK